ncbi:MAG: hypothetical protein HOP27_09780 [Anaerolineales bacterium]|jgi:hypothetical protein|nr:hypothetical protein [Anaerolineales bacterium]
MNLKSNSLKWAGIFSTAFLNAAVLLPKTFHVPAQIHPWLFVVNIFWLVTICSGIFSS